MSNHDINVHPYSVKEKSPIPFTAIKGSRNYITLAFYWSNCIVFAS